MLEISAPDGQVLESKVLRWRGGRAWCTGGKDQAVGFHALRVKLDNASNGTRPAYKLAVTYAGSQKLVAQFRSRRWRRGHRAAICQSRRR